MSSSSLTSLKLVGLPYSVLPPRDLPQGGFNKSPRSELKCSVRAAIRSPEE
jgi:hypothetical protein